MISSDFKNILENLILIHPPEYLICISKQKKVKGHILSNDKGYHEKNKELTGEL
jgi:hypothetical protein